MRESGNAPPPAREGYAGGCVSASQCCCIDCMSGWAPFENTGEDYLKSTALMEACSRSNVVIPVVGLAQSPGRPLSRRPRSSLP
jgi:hypothetical protein